MQLVDNPYLPPGMCFLCEQNRQEAKWVDTLLNYDPNVAISLRGRKYVCEVCILELASLLGLDATLKTAYDQLLSATRKVVDENDSLKKEVESLTNELLDYFKGKLEAALPKKRAVGRPKKVEDGAVATATDKP